MSSVPHGESSSQASASKGGKAADGAAEPKSPWVMVYPVYLNAKKTKEEGRRVPKNKAVDNPHVNEIFDICTKHLGLECIPEPDVSYSRDTLLKGRVKVKLRDAEGNPVNPKIKTKRALYVELGSLIPRLAARQSGQSVSAPVSGGASAGAGGGGGGGGKKKKGR